MRPRRWWRRDSKRSTHSSYSGYPTGTYSFLVQSVDAEGQESVWSPPARVTVMDLTGIAEGAGGTWRGLEPVGGNPFRGSIGLRFRIPSSCRAGDPIVLVVHDITGREVATLLEASVGRDAAAGAIVETRWSPKDSPSGIYFAHLAVGAAVTKTKLTLIR